MAKQHICYVMLCIYGIRTNVWRHCMPIQYLDYLAAKKPWTNNSK